MRKAFMNGVCSALSLFPDDTSSLEKLRAKYKDAVPSVSWNLSVKERADSAHKIREAINRLESVEKDVFQKYYLYFKDHERAESSRQSGPFTWPPLQTSQKGLLKKGKVKYVTSPDGSSVTPVSVGIVCFYSEDENGLQDLLAIRKDWQNVSSDIHKAYVDLENNTDA